MVNYPYISKTGALKEILGKIIEINVPLKFNQPHLETLGFKSKNDRPIVPVLKFLGFLDSEGVPQQPYKDYRDRAKSKSVLAQAIRKSYSDLFGVYSDADRKDNETLRNFFSTRTNVGEGALQYTVGTFKALCEMADFNGVSGPEEQVVQNASAANVPLPLNLPALPAQVSSGNPSVNINIELHLPPTTDAEVYNKLFEAMKKHLFEK